MTKMIRGKRVKIELDENSSGDNSPIIPLPLDVKEMIVDMLPFDDLKTLRLVDKAWNDVASTFLQKLATVKMTEGFLNHLLAETPKSTFGTRAKSFKLQYIRERSTLPFSDYGRRVCLAFRTKLEGDVETLSFCGTLTCSPKQKTTFLKEIFSTCPNVTELAVIQSDVFCLKGNKTSNGWGRPAGESILEPLPVLHHCKTIRWSDKSRVVRVSSRFPGDITYCLKDVCLTSNFFFTATPNVESVLTPSRSLLDALNSGYPARWPKLNIVDNASCCLKDLKRPLTRICYQNQMADITIAEDIRAHSETLDVVQFNNCEAGYCESIWESLESVKLNCLRTLSVTNLSVDIFFSRGFIFGHLFHSSPMQHGLSFTENFPALEIFRFTIREEPSGPKAYILLLIYLPFLWIDDERYPNVKTLELNWPNSEQSFEAWKHWTLITYSKFPSVMGNHHIERWKAMKEAGNDERVETALLDKEWVSFLKRYEHRCKRRDFHW